MMPAGFWDDLRPGWFLRWAVEQESRRAPGATVAVVSPTAGPLCGYVPHDPDGTRIVLTADDHKTGLA